MKLLGIEVKDYINFKHAILPLDRIGVTKITGKNLDSDTKLAPAGDDTNAVGKTALLSSIPQLIFASNPMTQEVKAKAKAKKDAFKIKGTSIALKVENKAGKEYTLEKRSNGKTTHYSIHKGSENTNVRTQAYPEEKIREMFDMTDDEFYTLWFISSSKPSKIQYGSAASRLQFFTNFFKLNNYDEVRKVFNGLLRASKDSKIALTEVLTQLEGLALEEESTLESLKKKLKKYKAKAEELSENYSSLHKMEMDLSFLEDSAELFTRWEKLAKKTPASTPKELKALIDKAALVLEASEAQATYLAAQNVYAKEKETFKAKRQKDEAALDNLSIEGKAPANYAEEKVKLERSLLQIAQARENYIKAIASINLIVFDTDAYDAAKKACRDMDVASLKEKKDKASDQYAVAINTQRSLKQILKHANCPTCNTEIDNKLSSTLYKQAQEAASKAQARVEKYTEQLATYSVYLALREAKDEKATADKEKKEYSDKLTATDTELKHVKKALKNLERWDEYFAIKDKLDALEAPDKPKAPKNFEYSKKDVSHYAEVQAIAPLVLPNYERYYAANESLAGKSVGIVRKAIQGIQEQLSECNEKIPKLTSRIDLSKQARKEYARLKDRQAELRIQAADSEILEMLVDAYSNKGLKLLLIKHIASVIEKNMNQYAPLVYPEKVTFKFEVVNDREFNILRGTLRKGVIVYDDVRVLSGAESRAFSFLLPLAIMPLIPKERRLNVMVLDEPTNNMGSARMELFVKNFIPKLCQLVPHLVVISTSDEVYPNSITYQVTKKNGKSTLIKVS